MTLRISRRGSLPKAALFLAVSLFLGACERGQPSIVVDGDLASGVSFRFGNCLGSQILPLKNLTVANRAGKTVCKLDRVDSSASPAQWGYGQPLAGYELECSELEPNETYSVRVSMALFPGAATFSLKNGAVEQHTGACP